MRTRGRRPDKKQSKLTTIKSSLSLSRRRLHSSFPNSQSNVLLTCSNSPPETNDNKCNPPSIWDCILFPQAWESQCGGCEGVILGRSRVKTCVCLVLSLLSPSETQTRTQPTLLQLSLNSGGGVICYQVIRQGDGGVWRALHSTITICWHILNGGC